MTNQPLKKLAIKYLRGSLEPFEIKFENKRKLTIIYGENGTGKSTICDAFEFIGKGKVGSIEGRGLGKTAPYWASLGKEAQDIYVALESSTDSCSAQIEQSEVIIHPPEFRPKVEILRRSQILSLVEAKPGDRYKVISRFIDVTSIEESEQTLIKLIKQLKDYQKEAIARIEENRTAIENFYSESGETGTDPLGWAETESQYDHNAFAQDLKVIDKLRRQYDYLTNQLERITPIKQEYAIQKQQLDQARARYNEVVQTTVKGSSQLLNLLQAAQHIFEEHPNPSVCPLCESTKKVDGLAFRTAKKIKQFADLDLANQQLKHEEQKFKISQERLKDLRKEVMTAAQVFQKYLDEELISEDISLPENPIPDNINQLNYWLDQTKHLPKKWVDISNQKQDKQKFLAALKRSIQIYQENLQSQQALAKLIPNLEMTQKIIEEERKQFTDTVLSQIAEKVGALYEKIHSGEGLNKISLQLDPKKRASLDINTEFNGNSGVPPQAYFSESHLDTLGLCVFLALAGMEAPDETILVLDDVLASVDEPHVERLIKLIHEEAEQFRHCIITTHYRPWKYKLRWGWVQNGQCQFIELTRWCPTKGISSIHDVPEIQRLKLLLSDSHPDPQLVCAKAGVVLEATLDFLTQLYECRVPRRADNRYTLGDLLPALDKKLKKALRVEILESNDKNGNAIYRSHSLEEIIERLTNIAQARNVFGAHFNTLSFELLESDAIQFGQTVLELTELLIDPERGWPRNNKSGSYWATSEETRRLHPLQRPS